MDCLSFSCVRVLCWSYRITEARPALAGSAFFVYLFSSDRSPLLNNASSQARTRPDAWADAACNSRVSGSRSAFAGLRVGRWFCKWWRASTLTAHLLLMDRRQREAHL